MLALFVCLVPLASAFSKAPPRVHPTAEGVFSVHVGDALRCNHVCHGDWHGPDCAGLPGSVVTVYPAAPGPTGRFRTAPLSSTRVDGYGWADVSGLAPGAYWWTVTTPAGTTARGVFEVGESLPARVVPCEGCSSWNFRVLQPEERPSHSWFFVELPDLQQHVYDADADAAAGETFTHADLARLPFR